MPQSNPVSEILAFRSIDFFWSPDYIELGVALIENRWTVLPPIPKFLERPSVPY